MNRPNPRVPTTLLARRSGALRRQLRKAAAGDPRGIHRARVASRRLREAVPVLASGLDGMNVEKLRRQVRRLTRALGPVRELDVAIALVDELCRGTNLPRVGLEDVRAHLVQERARRLTTTVKRLSAGEAEKLFGRLAAMGEALGTATAAGWRHVLAARLVRRAKRLDRSIAKAGSLYEVERLHAVRMAVKKLRYAVELAAEAGAATAVRHTRTLKAVQARLGRLHDLQVLQVHVGAVQAGRSHPGPRLPARLARLSAVARFIEEECRQLHARYVGDVQRLVATAEAVRRDVVADVVRPGAKTLKMPLARAARARRPDARERT